MKRIALLLAAVIISLAVEAHARQPQQTADAFLAGVKAGTINEAYDLLFEGSGIPTAKPQAVDALKTQTRSALPLYGAVLGHEFVRQEEFGASIVRLVYILKQEKAPTIWQFYFYKPADDWFLGTVMFNDQFQLLERKD